MTALDPGTLFASRFEIERRAGHGGMGVVYRAKDRHTGASVALKLMYEGGGGEGAERFGREARLLAELTHPGIVAYVAHGQAPGGSLFLAMEWLDGEDLAARLARGVLPLGECVVLVQRIAAALDVAHRRGVVHRDLKPSNLFLVGGAVERVKVLDLLAGRILVIEFVWLELGDGDGARRRMEALEGRLSQSQEGLLSATWAWYFARILCEASGDRGQARAELGETLRQVKLRADDITDPLWRESYLTKNPYCARALALGRAWEADAGATVSPSPMATTPQRT